MCCYRVVDNADKNYHYGFIGIGGEFVSQQDLQNKIDEIKASFQNTPLENTYQLIDIVNRLPPEWRVSYDIDGVVEI